MANNRWPSMKMLLQNDGQLDKKKNIMQEEINRFQLINPGFITKQYRRIVASFIQRTAGYDPQSPYAIFLRNEVIRLYQLHIKKPRSYKLYFDSAIKEWQNKQRTEKDDNNTEKTEICDMITDSIKMQKLKNTCISGDCIEFSRLLGEINDEICPNDYEELLITASTHNNVYICHKLLECDFYPIDLTIKRHPLLLACKTGNIELFDLIVKNTVLDSVHPLILFAIKYNQLKLVEHIIDAYTTKIQIEYLMKNLEDNKYVIIGTFPKIENKPWHIFYMTFDSDTTTDIDWTGKKYVFNKTDPFTIKTADALRTNQSNIELFKLLLPVFFPHYTTEQKTNLINNLISTSNIEGLTILKTEGYLTTFDKNYFILAKKNSTVEVVKFLVSCFQKK